MVNVGRDEDAHEIVALAQDVVGTPAYKNAGPLCCRLSDGITLYLEKVFLRHARAIEMAV